MGKKNAVVLFGGQSSEHVVSCMSVINVINHINRETYDLILIGITEEGRWIKTDTIEAIQNGTWKSGSVSAILSPDATMKSVVFLDGDKTELVKADVVFPVLHGLYGEDGTIQGLMELSGIPYVGCGVLSSAVSMDKLYTKIIVKDLGVKQADYVAVMRRELQDLDPIVKKVEDKFTYPVFVKPSNAGSSKGVSRAENGVELKEALILAGEHDRKILVEEMIVGREIECAVFGGGNTPTQASGVGEIVAAAEFYDFDAKYYNSDSKTVVNPVLPDGAAEKIRSAATAIFEAVDGYGLARVDFFVKEDGTVVFNEINTMPGFTAISMYPMLWEAAGITKEELVNRLLKHAADRSQS
ncbi:D-alanine--D-alanine ligase family protein [Lacrimispora algidixylanolytica]|uniref:D-alanine--D-alanine ligase n=1 Tax=Lacrimispora algidixylanolytica TaxID=94868 RepID=A0A419T370_9FIRM|nr:D-alanine--D-alanine ligase family protein [Lacrimispora algidixylanolytica]RKD31990.1 D-alanine--D-alanine ligase A [Lacrimispora algidixylanolytica]